MDLQLYLKELLMYINNDLDKVYAIFLYFLKACIELLDLEEILHSDKKYSFNNAYKVKS